MSDSFFSNSEYIGILGALAKNSHFLKPLEVGLAKSLKGMTKIFEKTDKMKGIPFKGITRFLKSQDEVK